MKIFIPLLLLSSQAFASDSLWYRCHSDLVLNGNTQLPQYWTKWPIDSADVYGNIIHEVDLHHRLRFTMVFLELVDGKGARKFVARALAEHTDMTTRKRLAEATKDLTFGQAPEKVVFDFEEKDLSVADLRVAGKIECSQIRGRL